MLGQTTFGTYVACIGTTLILLIFVVMFARLAMMLSLLFTSPTARLVRSLTRGESLVDDTEATQPPDDSQSST